MTTLSYNGGNIYIRQTSTTAAIDYSINNSTWTSLGTSWPVTIVNTNPSSSNILTVIFTTNLNINTTSIGATATNGYFKVGSEYITFNGRYNSTNCSVTINTITNYLGLIKNGDYDNGFSNIAILNIGVLISGGSTLNQKAGWIGHREYARTNIGCTVDNCYSTGPTNVEGGGIIGTGTTVTATNCYSTGDISGGGSGGIVGNSSTSVVINCYSNGIIRESAGGICGSRFSGTVTNCYSTGAIQGDYSGGICGGSSSSGTIQNCYSTGAIQGNNSGGICGFSYSGTIRNSYSTGAIQGNYSGGIVGSHFSWNISTLSLISDCSSSGNITGLNAGGITGALIAYTTVTSIKPYVIIRNCYSSGTVSNGGGSILGGDYTGTYATTPRLYLINNNALNTPLISTTLPTSPYIITAPIIYRAIRRPTNGILGNVIIDVSYTIGPGPLTGVKYSTDGINFSNVTSQNSATNFTVAGLTNTVTYKLYLLISSADLDDASASIVLPQIDPSSVPYAPTINSLTYDVSSTVISFNEPKFDGGSDISGYVYDLSMVGVTNTLLPLTTDSFTSNTITMTTYTGTEGFRNGVYDVSSSSSVFPDKLPYNLFNTTKPQTYWWGAFNGSGTTITGDATDRFPYTSTGVYQGSNSDTTKAFFTTNVIGLGTISGEWIQIRLPYKLLLTGYTLRVRFDQNDGWQLRGFKTFNIAGSNNGSNWYLVDSQNVASAGGEGYKTFTVSTPQTVPYAYYRLVIKSIFVMENQDINGSVAQLGRWIMNGNYVMDPVFRNPFSVTLSNFSPYTLRMNNLGSGTYYYKLYAVNKLGTSKSIDASFILGTNAITSSSIINTPNPPIITRIDPSNNSLVVYFASVTDVSYVSYSITGTNGPFTKSFDMLSTTSKTGLVGAYSLQKLSNFYNGPIVRIRRGNDNSLNDFYIDSYGRFANNSGTLINTWLSGAIGYINTWYDQSGKGKNGTQTTDTAQPTISGDFISVPNVCYLDFSYNRYFNLPDGTVPSENSAYTVSYKHGNIDNVDGTILGSGNYGYNNQTLTFRRFNNNNGYRHYWWSTTHDFGTYVANNVVTETYDPALASGKVKGYINGSFINSVNNSNRNSGIANNTIGAGNKESGSYSEFLNGVLYHIYIFNVPLDTTDRNIIENKVVAVSPLYPFIIPNLTNGTSYSISLTSTSSLGTSSPSDAVSATPGVPANPTITITPRARQLDVSSVYTTYGLTTTYYYNISGGTDISSASPQFSITGLTGGQQYTIYVRASNIYGYSSYTIVSATPYDIPSPPSFVTVTQNSSVNRLDVSFGAPVSNGGSAITNYLYTYTGQGGVYTSLASAIPVTFSILNPTKGTTITVSVIARNAGGDSYSTSSVITLVPDTMYFNGTSGSYIDISNTVDLSFGTGDFTIEWMQYSTGTSLVPYIFQKGAFGVSIEFNNLFYNWPSTTPFKIENYKNRWTHIAISRVSGTKYILFDGRIISNTSDSTNYTNNSTFTIGNNNIKSSASTFQGYLYNFHVVKGVGKYNANFVVSNTGISTTTGTSVLINGYDVSGSSASSVNKVGVVTSFQAIYTVPGQVTGVSATGGYKTIVCRFTAPTYTGGFPILGYRYSIDGGVTYVNIISTSNPYFTIRDLADNTLYSVMVVAYNKYGNGIPSVSVNATTVVGNSNIPQTVNVLSVLPTQENFNIGYENKLAVAAANSYSYAINDGSFVNVAKANPILVGMSPPVFSVGTITLNSITINYTLPSYPILRYYYNVRTTAGFVMDGSFSVATYPSSYTIFGIVPNTPYKISLQFVDVNGLGPKTTLVHYYYLAPPAPVTGLTLVSKTDTTAYIRYTAPTGIVSSYDISAIPTTGGTSLSYAGITDVSYMLTGLSSGKYYNINVYANNISGRSSASVLNIITLVGIPDISVNTIRGTSTVYTFSVVSSTADSGIITGNTLVYSDRTNRNTTTLTNVTSGSTLTGLSVNTTYDLSLVVVYANTTSIVDGFSFSTLSNPNVPSSFSVYSTGIDTITLSIGKPTGSLTGYVVKTFNGSTFISDTTSNDAVSSNVFVTVGGLSTGITYTFYAYTVLYDISSSFTTGVNALIVNPVTGLNVVSKTNNSIYISYTGSATAASYDLSINPAMSGSFTGYTDTSYNFTGLASGTSYIIRVVARNSVYSSLEASLNVVTFMNAPSFSATSTGRTITTTFTPAASTGAANSGSITGNTIVYSKKGSTTFVPITGVSSGYIIIGLDPSSVYDLSLTTQYQNTNSITAFRSQNTLTIPNPPSSISTGIVTTTSIIITLGKPTGTLPFTGYTINTYQGSTFVKTTNSTDNTSTSINITISGLTSSTTYISNAFTYYSDVSSNTSLTTTSTTAAQLYPTGLNTTSLKIYYNFEGNDNSLNRVNPGQYNLLYNGVTISNTIYKRGTQSLSFQKNLSQSASLNPFTPTTNGLSFSFWMKANCVQYWETIFTFDATSEIYDVNDNILFYINESGTNTIGLSVYSRGGNSYSSTNKIVNDNTWHHIVWTLSYSTNTTESTWNLYVDNVLSYTNTEQRYPSTTYEYNLNYIGLSTSDGFYYNGYLDEFYIFDRVLTTTDVNILYNV